MEMFGPIDYSKLREELDGLQSVGPDFWVGRDLNSFWICTTGGPNATTGPKTPTRVDINSFWTDSGFSVPAGYDNTRIITRRRFSYPFFSIYTRWVDYTDAYNDVTMRLLGQDHDCMAEGILFGCNGGKMVFQGDSVVAEKNSDWYCKLTVSSLMPSDYLTARHFYAIKLNRSWAELYIDGVLRGIILFGCKTPKRDNTYPYVLGSVAGVPPSMCSAMIKIERDDYPPSAITFPLELRRNGVEHPVEVVDGDPLPPRNFELYVENSNTKWTGLSISSGSITSHPVPALGYVNKTIYFMANQAGTLNIEILTRSGNWRTYDSITISASVLLRYKMTGDAVLLRLTFTPSTYPCTVNEAEVNLNG